MHTHKHIINTCIDFGEVSLFLYKVNKHLRQRSQHDAASQTASTVWVYK